MIKVMLGSFGNEEEFKYGTPEEAIAGLKRLYNSSVEHIKKDGRERCVSILIDRERQKPLKEPNPIEYYLLHMWGDVEPHMHGPFKTMKQRDAKARRMKKTEGNEGGLYWLDMERGKPTVGAYTGIELDPTGENTQ